MSPTAVRFHPAAMEETEAARDWYQRRSIQAAEMFLDEVDRAINVIRSDPG